MNCEHEKGYDGPLNGTSLALGFFDGVHIGHQAVIQAAVDKADELALEPAVFTFTTGGANGPKSERRIQSPEQKHRSFEALGVHCCFEPTFEQIKHLSPEAFFHELLVGRYRARALFSGDDFHFGAGRAGDTALLAALCKEAGIYYQTVPTALWQGEPVSSTRIRAALKAGDIPAANAMLGRPYEIQFPVQRGKRLGHTLGFPTINQVFPADRQPPAFGVYITQTWLDGVWYPSATGFGTRPTVNGDSPTCETFITGFDGDLYNKRVTVQFYERLAAVQKFESPAVLAEAVQRWAADARRYFAQKENTLGLAGQA